MRKQTASCERHGAQVLSAKELASFSACVVLQVRGETAYVLDVIRERLEYPDLRRKAIELHKLWRYAANRYELVIENKGSGMSLVQDLQQQGIYAMAVDPVGDKVMRMHAQTARIEAGSVFLPKHALWVDEFRRETSAFPAGRHSDQVDAFSQALHRAYDRSQGGFSCGYGGLPSSLWGGSRHFAGASELQPRGRKHRRRPRIRRAAGTDCTGRSGARLARRAASDQVKKPERQ